MNDRQQRIKKYGIEIVEHDEAIWLSRGFTVNPDSGLLEKINY